MKKKRKKKIDILQEFAMASEVFFSVHVVKSQIMLLKTEDFLLHQN